jgi:hypothetical protein
MSAIRDIVFMLANIENNIVEKYAGIFEDEKLCELTIAGLVNFAGNFIFQNSVDKKTRFLNYENFIANFKKWIKAAEDCQKKH